MAGSEILRYIADDIICTTQRSIPTTSKKMVSFRFRNGDGS